MSTSLRSSIENDRSLHKPTRPHAVNPSSADHKSAEPQLESGNIVENRARRRGDCLRYKYTTSVLDEKFYNSPAEIHLLCTDLFLYPRETRLLLL
jgi:hypothetical protein